MAKSTKSAKKRINVQSLPTAAKELTKTAAKEVKGGFKVSKRFLVSPASQRRVRKAPNPIPPRLH